MNWRTSLQSTLMNYSNTKHPSTGLEPSKLFLNRDLCHFMPNANTEYQISPHYQSGKPYHEIVTLSRRT